MSTDPVQQLPNSEDATMTRSPEATAHYRAGHYGTTFAYELIKGERERIWQAIVDAAQPTEPYEGVVDINLVHTTIFGGDHA